MEITKVEVFKSGELIATCDENIRSVEVSMADLPPMTVFSLPLVELERIKIFEHLNGRPLSSFFNKAGIRVHEVDVGDDERAATDTNWSRDVEPVFYIHGRSETMRGKTTVSAVILAQFRCPEEDLPSIKDLLPQLPAIYKEIASQL
jgi:hypothetical protein